MRMSSNPRAFSAQTVALPMKPAPPVTTIVPRENCMAALFSKEKAEGPSRLRFSCLLKSTGLEWRRYAHQRFATCRDLCRVEAVRNLDDVLMVQQIVDVQRETERMIRC